jgi:hypothetical protein
MNLFLIVMTTTILAAGGARGRGGYSARCILGSNIPPFENEDICVVLWQNKVLSQNERRR